MKKFRAALPPAADKEFTISASGGQCLEFNTYGTTKGNALTYLLDYLDIPQKEAMVFGDNNNDLSDFSLPDVFKVAMGKYKKYALLLESLLFYWLISGVYLVYLLLSVGAIYGFGLWLRSIFAARDAAVKAAEKAERKAVKKVYQKRARRVMTLGVLLHIGLILVLKYTGFFLENVNALFGLTISIPAFVKPLGLSFFILQSVSYLVDVYRQTIPADGNVLRLGLYLSFFPGIVEGPICRYGDTAQALWDAKPIAYENLCLGLQRIAFGLMKKLVIADRLNPMVEELFSRNDAYPGYMSLVGGVLYTLQLYADFSGSMDAVCGTAQIFGLTVPENFRRPFFSRNICGSSGGISACIAP